MLRAKAKPKLTAPTPTPAAPAPVQKPVVAPVSKSRVAVKATTKTVAVKTVAAKTVAAKTAGTKTAATKTAATKAPAAKADATKTSAVKEVAVKKVEIAKPAIQKLVTAVVLAKSKPKLVRDSFTMPKAEYAVIESLKQRAAKLDQSAKKSEMLRAGIKALSAMTDANLLAALLAIPTIKTGRPKHASAKKTAPGKG